jgi:hypothetical protein
MADFKIDGLPTRPQLDSCERQHGDRRKEARHKLQDGLRVQVNIPPLPGTFEGELSDATPSGAGIMVGVALSRGTIITFRCGAQRVYATVAHCRADMQGFFVGVKINDAVEEPEQGGSAPSVPNQ